MTVRVDPEQNETRALFSSVDLDGRRVLEIGCGDGRLTWHYADRAAQVTAIEPFGPALARAREHLPQGLVSRVTLCPIAFDEFAAATASSTFDVAILSWSLCCMEQGDMVPALEDVHRLVAPGGTVSTSTPCRVPPPSRCTASLAGMSLTGSATCAFSPSASAPF